MCTGPSVFSQLSGGNCLQLNPIIVPFNLTGLFVKADCTPVCFHESQEIVYKGGAPMTMQSVLDKKHPDCVVPHVRTANGVVVHTTCSDKPLRVTDEHLVYTSSGLRAALTLKAGFVCVGRVVACGLCSLCRFPPPAQQRYPLLGHAGDASVHGQVRTVGVQPEGTARCGAVVRVVWLTLCVSTLV